MPVGNATADYLKQFNAYYAQNTQDKVIYLTFDAGYENGNTAAILDALKKHNVHATFFLVGNYLQTSPDLVKANGCRGPQCGKPYLPPSGYVENLHQRKPLRRN